MLRKINSLEPDIIILDGDIVDEDLAPVIQQNLGDSLKALKAKLGVWAITGNHEYIGGVVPAVKYLTEHNIQFIRDSAILVDSRFWLVGREDRDKQRFTGQPRKPLEELMKEVDLSYPVIVLDHQPFQPNEKLQRRVSICSFQDIHIMGSFFPLISSPMRSMN